MKITSIAAHSMTAKGICLGAELGPEIGLGHISRAIHIGPLTLVTSARNDDKAAWLEAADAAEKLVGAAEGMHRWALAQAEAADDLKAERSAKPWPENCMDLHGDDRTRTPHRHVEGGPGQPTSTADDLKTQRETVAQARRLADFGDLTLKVSGVGAGLAGYDTFPVACALTSADHGNETHYRIYHPQESAQASA